MSKRSGGGTAPGGGEPGADRGGSPEPGAVRRRRRRPCPRYTPEQRRHLLEAYRKSGMTVDAYCATVRLSTKTLCVWKRRYAEEGPRGLEPRKRGPKAGSGVGSRLPEAIQGAIRQTKSRFPDFGLRKVRDFMGRFLQLRVSAGGVRRVLRDAGVGPVVRGKRRHRRIEEPRRFERSRPGDLWQSDITSYRLARHDRRVYLTVFLDDFSRYVVAWNLQLHQRQELVTECLLDGIQRFGKPREVLTDRGRQYYAWRGRSDFQKQLVREGIAHVVARVQHPETVGKCERLWDTVSRELWERVHPQELDEARERLGHYFKHYNHLRPHQGLGGMTPADRFFGLEERVRREVEGAQAENALRLAVDGAPVERSYLLGSLDGQPVAVVRTGKGLEIVTGDGAKEEGEDGHGGGDEEDADGEAPEAPSGIPDAPEGGGGGAGAVGGGVGGGEEAGARGGDGDPIVVAGTDDEVGGRRTARGDAAEAVAAGADGALGDDGGAAEAAAEERAPGSGGGGAATAGGGAGEGAVAGAGPGDDPRADAGAP